MPPDWQLAGFDTEAPRKREGLFLAEGRAGRDAKTALQGTRLILDRRQGLAMERERFVTKETRQT
jgi:hypothetical protein